jgi:hypothetical protein
MKIVVSFQSSARQLLGTSLLLFCAAFVGTHGARAGDVTDGKSTLGATPGATAEEETIDYKNWIELGIGGVSISGNSAQFKQDHGISGDVFGGIQDMHFEENVGKKAVLSVDGHAIFDNNDYDVKVELSQPGLGYIRAGYTAFRTWYDGDGGFFPPHGTFIQPQNQDLHIDRDEEWVEIGLRAPNWPEITLRYSHEDRYGQKDSTIWGDTTLTGIAVNPARKIAPAFRDIDESRDIFSLDAVKTFGNTDVGLGMRFEHNDNDDSLNLERGAGQLPPAVPAPGAQRFITQNDHNDLDAYNGHVTTETRLSESLWFTTAYSYSTLGSDISGTRIYGSQYDSMFGDPVITLQNRDEGFLNLVGTSQVDEHVFNINLLWMPVKDLTVLTAFRYTHQDKEADSIFLDTSTAANTAPFTPTNPKGGFHAVKIGLNSENTSESFDNYAQRLELRYAGIKNWLFYTEGEWEEECGNVHEHEVVGPTNQGSMNKDTSQLWQKYTAGANWYPTDRLNLSAQYYYKVAEYDNDFLSDVASPPTLGSERNQRLLNQDWSTNDANIRITWRPKIPACLGTLSLVSRYDYVSALITGQWGISPAGTGSGLTGTILDSEHTALITNHEITETLTWNPLARLYLQGTASYVLNQTDTPAANINLIPNTSPTITNFRDDYWTAVGGVGFILNQKTDLHADYTFYRADDYLKNVRVALPYGIGATEHTVSVSISRQLAKNVRLTVKYAYFNYADETFGGHNNYEAHSVFSSLQFRF